MYQSKFQNNKYKAATHLEGFSTLGHISKENIVSTSSSFSHYSTEYPSDLNDLTYSQNNFISDNVTEGIL